MASCCIGPSLSAPLDDVELIFTITQLPVGPGGVIVGWAALILGIVMCAGCVVMYRFGAAQIDLTRAQQNFVSAVSHELKTPLTSIRMYGEILKAGWASEEKKRTYYDFIYHESERLSRLIANVLQLARLTRNGERPEPKRVPVAQLLNLVEVEDRRAGRTGRVSADARSCRTSTRRSSSMRTVLCRS